MDFGAIAIVSGSTRLMAPPSVVTAVSAVDRDPNIKRREPDQIERIVEQKSSLPTRLEGVF